MLGRGIGWPLGVAVGLLAFVGVAASVTHYLQEPYNPSFLRFPTVVALHVVLGGVTPTDAQIAALYVETLVSTRSGKETLQERETIVFSRQEDGSWLAVHEHLSPAGSV